jgi:hypothetical protein
VSNPVTHHNWFLFSFGSSLVLLTKHPCRNPVACLSPVKDSRYFLWSLFVQSVTAFLAVPDEMPQAGSGPMSGHSDPDFASWWAISDESMSPSSLRPQRHIHSKASEPARVLILVAVMMNEASLCVPWKLPIWRSSRIFKTSFLKATEARFYRLSNRLNAGTWREKVKLPLCISAASWDRMPETLY